MVGWGVRGGVVVGVRGEVHAWHTRHPATDREGPPQCGPKSQVGGEREVRPRAREAKEG